MTRYRHGKTDAARDGSGGLEARAWAIDDTVLSAIVVITAALVLLARGGVGVIPGDTGTLAHAAERVLDGELPHRDFDDPYSGGLSVLNAASFAVWGEHVSSMRRIWIAASAAFCGLAYYLARRALNRAAALGIVAALFLWSMPNYPSPMPTWYNLFLAAAGVWALDRYLTTERLRWVAVAGALAGASLLFKVVGLYFFAAAGLFFVFHAQSRSLGQADRVERSSLLASSSSAAAIWAGLGLVAAAVISLIAVTPRIPELTTFAAPTVALAGFLAYRERQAWRIEPAARLLQVFRDTGLLLAGAAVSLVVYLAPYALSGSLGSWWEGVFVKPQLRLGDAHMGRPIDPALFCGALFGVGSMAAAVTIGVNTRYRLVPVLFVAALGFCLLTMARDRDVYALVWESLRLAPLAAVGVGIVVLNRREADDEGRRSAGRTFLWLALAALFSLVQYPLAHGIYFLYLAPVLFLAVAHLAAQSERVAAAAAVRPAGVALLSFVVLFGGTWVYAANPTLYGVRYSPCNWNSRLSTERARIRYDPATARIYNSLIDEVRRHSARESCILALPDCPEIYYFTGRRNPTRTFFDAFDGDYGRAERDRRILRLIERHNINVVVLREWGAVSTEAVSEELFAELERLFPHRRRIGDARKTFFSILWRDEGPKPDVAAQAVPAPDDASCRERVFSEGGKSLRQDVTLLSE
jgi:hypothetical protein